MKKRRLIKRGLAYLMTIAMVLGLMAGIPGEMASVQAADGINTGTNTDKIIECLGTSVIADPEAPTSNTDEWEGSYVYFGTYDKNGDGTAEPVKYRVLASNTDVFGGTTMLLDCDSILWDDAFDVDSNVWADSDIRTYLNGTFLTNSFSTAEQSAIAQSTKSEADGSDGVGDSDLSYISLAGDKIFLLDAKEATNRYYGYTNEDVMAANREKSSDNYSWWLRSSQTGSNSMVGIALMSSGISITPEINSNIGVSPALNVNLSSVLFTSVIYGDAGDTGAEYKLTIIDDDMTMASTGNVERSGDVITIPYTISGTNSANATQVSILLLDEVYTEENANDAEVLYYGALDTSVNNSSTGTFTLPSEFSDKICGRDYYAYIVAEDINGTYETDYASTPVEIEISEEIDSVLVEVDAPIGGEAFDTSATISTQDYSVTSVTWKKGSNTVTGNADYNMVYTVNVTLTAQEGLLFTENTEATVNNNTATVTRNDDGTITVSYTFDRTQMGTIISATTGYEGTYDGQAHSITVEVTEPSDVTISYSTDEEAKKNYTTTKPTFTDAGEYTVYYKIQKDNYTTIEGSQTVKISKKEVTIVAADQTINYGDSIDNTKYTVTGLLEGDSINKVTLTTSTSDATDNGTIAVSIDKIVNTSGNDVTANYDVKYTDGKLVISKGVISYTATGYEGTYDGQAHSITVEVTEPSDVTISYSTDEEAKKNYTTTKPTFTDAGEYTVYYKIEKDNYTTIEGSQTVKISKKEIAIVAADQTVIYGNSIDNTKYTVTGLLEGDSINKVTLTPSTSDATDNGTIAVIIDKILNVSGNEVTTNYDVKCIDGKLTIYKTEEPKDEEIAPEEPKDEESEPEEPKGEEPKDEEIEHEETIEYEIIEGVDSQWTEKSGGCIKITGNGDFTKFIGLRIDGEIIDVENYTIESETNSIILNDSYLKSLLVGKHKIEIVWEDGFASTTITIKQAEDSKDSDVPKTGDNSAVTLWFMLLIVSGFATVGFWKKKKHI